LSVSSSPRELGLLRCLADKFEIDFAVLIFPL